MSPLASNAPNLKFQYLWLVIGYSLIALVVYLSLTSSPVDLNIDIKYQDKFFHALAYFSLMFWFGQIYYDKIRRIVCAFLFVVMGVGMEYLQGFDPARYFEFADMLANTTGVILGLLLAMTPAKTILLIFEKRFL